MKSQCESGSGDILMIGDDFDGSITIGVFDSDEQKLNFVYQKKGQCVDIVSNIMKKLDIGIGDLSL